MKKGYHIWPYSGKPHPVGEKHKPKPESKPKKQGGYKIANNTYKEGK